MYFDSFLPFLRKAPIINQYKKAINISDVLLPVLVDVDDEVTKLMRKNILESNKMEPRVYLVMPLNIYVINEDVVTANRIVEIFSTIECNVDVVDYSLVACDIEMDEKKERALYPAMNGGYEVLNGIISFDLVKDAVGRVRYETVKIARGKVKEQKLVINEALGDGSIAELKKRKKPREEKAKLAKPPLEVIEDHLKSTDVSKVVPRLNGETGLAKSALIYALVEKLNKEYMGGEDRNLKWGFRVKDLRGSTIHAMDFDGLMYRNKDILKDKEGKPVKKKVKIRNSSGAEEIVDSDSYEEIYTELESRAMMADIAECSDVFVEYARRVVEKLRERIKTENDPERKEKIGKVLKSFEYKARIPVVFFDEINRADLPVQNIFMQMVDRQEYGGMDFKICRFVAAANMVEVQEGSSASMNAIKMRMYVVKGEANAEAGTSRFFNMDIGQMKDLALESWMEWATGPSEKWSGYQSKGDGYVRQNIHPLIVGFIGENPDFIYKEADLENAINAFNRSRGKMTLDEVVLTNFANYRSWEFLSNYLYQAEVSSDAPVVKEAMIEKIIGPTATEALLGKGVLDKNFKVDKKSEIPPMNDMEQFLYDCYEAKVPCLLAGPSNLGKTEAIISLAMSDPSKISPDPIFIELGSKRGWEFGGFPSLERTEDFVLGGDRDLMLREEFKDIKEIILDELQKAKTVGTGLDRVTVRRAIANESMSRLRRTISDPKSKDIVLVFDEVNRVMDESVWNAVLKAVSDHELYGVKFNPAKVFIVLACNINMEGTKQLDQAVASRCAVFYRKKYIVNDAKNFLDYMVGDGNRFYNSREGGAGTGRKKKVHDVLREFLRIKRDDAMAREQELLSEAEARGEVSVKERMEIAEKAWGELREMIASIEKLTPFKPQPTKKSFTVLNSKLINAEANPSSEVSWKGSLIFVVDKGIIGKFEDMERLYDGKSLKSVGSSRLGIFMEDLIKFLEKTISGRWGSSPAVINWAGAEKKSDTLSIDYIALVLNLIQDNKEMFNKDLSFEDEEWRNFEDIEVFREWVFEAVLKMYRKERKIDSNRKWLFEKSLGKEYGSEFRDFYNQRNGREVKEYVLEDIGKEGAHVISAIVKQFIDKRVKAMKAKNSHEGVEDALSIDLLIFTIRFFKMYPSLKKADYRAWLEAVYSYKDDMGGLSGVQSMELGARLARYLISADDLIEMLYKAEGVEEDTAEARKYINGVSVRLSRRIYDDEWEILDSKRMERSKNKERVKKGIMDRSL